MLLLPIIVVIGVQQFVVDEDTQQTECRRAARLLRGSGALRPEMANVLARVLRELAPQRTVIVNGEYRDDALMVYLVDAKLLASREGNTLIAGHRLSQIVRNNFVAISPNVIVVDDVFLTMLIATAFNDSVGYTQVAGYTRNIEVRPESKMDSPEVQRVLHISEMFAAASTYQQYTNLQELNTGDEDWRTIGAGLIEAWNEDDPVAGNRANNERIDITHTLLVTSLGPLFSHELGHLEHGRNGQLAASGLLGWSAAAAQRDAERQADLYAARFIERRLDELQRANGNNQDLLFMEIQPLFWFVKLLRELALAEAFQNFRGLDVRDALMSIEHKGCAEPPTIYPINGGDFWRSEQNRIPVLTEKEWRRIRARLLHRRQTASHDDAITRAREIIAARGPNFDSAGAVVLEYVEFFQAVTNDDPSIMARERLPGIGIKASTFMRDFAALGTFERAAGFDKNRTHVVVLQGGGYVEVRGDDEIEYMRVVMPRPLDNSPDTMKTYLDNTIRMSAIAASLMADGKTAIKAIQQLFLEDANCRWSSRQTAIGDVGLRFRRLNNSDFFVLEVVHRTQLPEVRVLTDRDLRPAS